MYRSEEESKNYEIEDDYNLERFIVYNNPIGSLRTLDILQKLSEEEIVKWYYDIRGIPESNSDIELYKDIQKAYEKLSVVLGELTLLYRKWISEKHYDNPEEEPWYVDKETGALRDAKL